MLASVSREVWGGNVANRQVGVIGATSLVGRLLLLRLVDADCYVAAFTQRHPAGESGDGVEWRQLGDFPPSPHRGEGVIPFWICVAPIWVLPEHFSLLEAYGVRRIIALSSTSRFAKLDSADSSERQLARRLEEAEKAMQGWAEDRGIEWVILRPTLIYGLGQDKNISEIARFIRRFGFFPLLGSAQGLRQPIHAEDVAEACAAALLKPEIADRDYNITGSETLPYREMVGRVFAAMDRSARFVSVPLWVFRLVVAFARVFPRYRHWSFAMAERMNSDLVFDGTDAVSDFGFNPRGFVLSEEEVVCIK
jgi:uncharacterized protein YbjT (DUF2867 family)